MKQDCLHHKSNAAPIDISPIGLRVQQRIAPEATGALATLIETTDQPGFGPPQHRHEIETEVFHVLEGRYLFELDGVQFQDGAGLGKAMLPIGTSRRNASTMCCRGEASRIDCK